MKLQIKTVVLIGAGNVATAIAKALPKKYKVLQVYSKHIATAKKLASRVNSKYTNNIDEVLPNAGIYIIAVKDDAIQNIAAKLKLKNKIVVHTSGSVDMNVLGKASKNYGVIWPLQSFPEGSSLKNKAPFCIDASSKKILDELKQFVNDIGGTGYYINSDKRAKLHLSAVFANNFTNHLLGIAYQILKKEKLPFELLMPIITETVNNLNGQDPFKSQTCPAIRRDKKTIKKHRNILSDNKQFLKVYDALTKSIQKSSHAKKL